MNEAVFVAILVLVWSFHESAMLKRQHKESWQWSTLLTSSCESAMLERARNEARDDTSILGKWYSSREVSIIRYGGSAWVWLINIYSYFYFLSPGFYSFPELIHIFSYHNYICHISRFRAIKTLLGYTIMVNIIKTLVYLSPQEMVLKSKVCCETT